MEEDGALQLLESRNSTHTATELRNTLKQMLKYKAKRLTFLEYACAMYGCTWDDLNEGVFTWMPGRRRIGKCCSCKLLCLYSELDQALRLKLRLQKKLFLPRKKKFRLRKGKMNLNETEQTHR